jgi:predicted GIY-YIG superfamily endonuclease
MQFWVYILRCSDGSYYTGHTDDLEKRLWEHSEGKGSDWTRHRRPVELVWCDWAGTRDEALAFERRVKNWNRAKKEGLIAGDWARVGYFARPPHERFSSSPGKEAAVPPEAHGSRPSTSLGTNEVGALHKPSKLNWTPTSFVPSEVEGRRTSASANRQHRT